MAPNTPHSASGYLGPAVPLPKIPTNRQPYDCSNPGTSVIEGMLQAPVNPGHSQLHLHWRHRLYRIPVTFVFDPTDTYADGTPDFLRLHTTQDRQAFRAWFTDHR